MKRWIATLLFCFTCFNAQAVTFSLDTSDLWWDPAEPGSGVQVVQQGDTLFITFFGYNQAQQPTWFVGSDIRYSGPVGSGIAFTGRWFQTTGSFHQGPYNPRAFTLRDVGTATFTLKGQNSATLVYVVDGVTVTRTLVRQNFKVNNLSGSYLGAAVGTYGSCATLNTYQEDPGFVTVTHDPNSNSFAMSATQAGGVCNYNGTYEPTGRLGAVVGSFSCSNGGLAGTFLATEVEGSALTFGLRMSIRGPGQCTFNGRIGGMRQGQ